MPYDIAALPADLQPTAIRLGKSINFSDCIEKGANRLCPDRPPKTSQ